MLLSKGRRLKPKRASIIGRPDELILYKDDAPVGPVKPVDAVDNARFHAPQVEFSYAELLRKRLEAGR